ncbi:hypothetical protein SISSUDRAFT_1055676 [Sistotremastrum suecicum HHB10207 ss-3]|uniref:Uncharacterized protein n=1 Tax=Sistotremastrum suecicum HHB10207 ss-3 TaxID=1314776 RepID=A0A165XLX8_9AGAM|nr:hypothetical protein SISSUDRAFT_1055676 [Sistotremastrum suecicum HHB10207 ss-3]
MWQSPSKAQGSASRGEASVARNDATWGWVDRDKDLVNVGGKLDQQERGIIGGAALLPVDLSRVQDEWKKRRWHKKRLFSGLEPSD